MEKSARAPRRTAIQWQAIVEQQMKSGMTTTEFCKAEGIAYQSFMNWKKKLVVTDGRPTEHNDGFVELTEAFSSNEKNDSGWFIELDLAPGIQLRIAR